MHHHTSWTSFKKRCNTIFLTEYARLKHITHTGDDKIRSSPDKYTSNIWYRRKYHQCCGEKFITQYLQPRIITLWSANGLLEIKGLYEGSKKYRVIVCPIDGFHTAIQFPRTWLLQPKSLIFSGLTKVWREDLHFSDVPTEFSGKVHDASVFRISPFCTTAVNA